MKIRLEHSKGFSVKIEIESCIGIYFYLQKYLELTSLYRGTSKASLNVRVWGIRPSAKVVLYIGGSFLLFYRSSLKSFKPSRSSLIRSKDLRLFSYIFEVRSKL